MLKIQHLGLVIHDKHKVSMVKLLWSDQGSPDPTIFLRNRRTDMGPRRITDGAVNVSARFRYTGIDQYQEK